MNIPITSSCISMGCNDTVTILVDEDMHEAWCSGIVDTKTAFPNLTDEERERLDTHQCPHCRANGRNNFGGETIAIRRNILLYDGESLVDTLIKLERR